MKSLITPEEVVLLAYSPVEQSRPERFPVTVILEAQEKFLRPVFGEFLNALLRSEYPDFQEEYVKPALACYVKYLLSAEQSRELQQLSGETGSNLRQTLAEMRRDTLARARTLIDRCTAFLESSPQTYPAYDPTRNIRSRIRIEGGVVF